MTQPRSAGAGNGDSRGRLRDQADRWYRRIAGWPRWCRIGVGVSLIGGGLLGFLPILGFWMIPLGIAVLSLDLAMVRRWRRRLVVSWLRRRRAARFSARPGRRSRCR